MGLGSQRCGLDEARSRGGGLGMIDAGDWERQHRGATMAGIMASSREIGGHVNMAKYPVEEKSPKQNVAELLDVGKMFYGCKHYKRRCKIRAPCCNKIYPCRHCHDEATSNHELIRYDVQQVVCSVCDKEQPAARVCINCGICMGEYYCNICKFYDDDITKQQFHCHQCGICRIGGRKNYFHCKKCGGCCVNLLRDNHKCVNNSLRQNCPICDEFLFESLKKFRAMNCGHTIHFDCYKKMVKLGISICPICSKSLEDVRTHISFRLDSYMSCGLLLICGLIGLYYISTN
ncbi:hypothetical protein M0R45_026481 [Rubus argutus]|uniref:Uncharacterized protein n=1 Tax=Rubus argutus TaxID=59490 RepID=A0AAW1WXK8_RUBAR